MKHKSDKNCVTALKILQYHEYLYNYISECGRKTENESLVELISENETIITCSEILLKLNSIYVPDAVPLILEDVITVCDHKLIYKFQEDFEQLFVDHLDKIIGAITHPNYELNSELFEIVQTTLTHFNKLKIGHKIENLFMSYFTNILQSNKTISELLDCALEAISNPNTIFFKIIITSLENGWDFEIVSNSLIVTLFEHLNKRSYLLNEPDYFHTTFNQTHDFLMKIENLFFDEAEIRQFRKSPNMINLLKCWNILKYFQMRRRSFIDKITKTLQDCTNDKNNAFPELIRLSIEHLKWCLSPQILLPQLSGRFWGLFLQGTHIILNTLKSQDKASTKNYRNIDDIIVIESSLDHFQLSVNEIVDKGFKVFLESNLIKKDELIANSMNDVRNLIVQTKTHFEDILIETLINKANGILEETKNVPRFYRNTNRESPIHPSNHILKAIDLLVETSKKYPNQEIFPRAYESVKNHLNHLVSSAIEYLKKSESSLQRLKSLSANKSASLESGNQMSTDDFQKIYRQFQIDIDYFNEHL